MAINYFTLTEGVLELHDEKLVIFDNAKRDRISHLVSTIGVLLYSLGSMFRGYKDNNNLLILIGIILAIILLFFLLKKRDELQRIDNEIYLKDISEVSFKEGKDDTIIATIMTKKKRTRKIIIEKIDNLASQFKSDLKDLNIKVSSF